MDSPTPDSENPNASVAILCPYIFFVEAFKNILDHYPNAEIVPDFTSTPSGEKYTEIEKGEFRAWLKKSNLPWRDIETTGLTAGEFFAKYGTLIAPYYGGWIKHSAVKNHRKIRIFYGAAKDLWAFSLWNVHFDLICTPGPYFTETLSKLYGGCGVRAVSTGEPKLDLFASISKKDARDSLFLSNQKPVVLVASTWGGLSSLQKIAGALISISESYQVVVKAHHMTSLYDSESLSVFKGTPVHLIDQTTPISTALAAADVVISDGSGAIFDALLTDKPLIIIDTIGTPDNSFFIETAFYGIKESKFLGVPTRPQSLEQIIKKPMNFIGSVLEIINRKATSKELSDKIENSLKDTAQYETSRKNFLSSHFTPLDGRASARIASEIAKIAQVTSAGRNVESNLFVSLVDDLQKRANQEAQAGYEKKETEQIEKLRRVENFKNLPIAARLRAVINEFFS